MVRAFQSSRFLIALAVGATSIVSLQRERDIRRAPPPKEKALVGGKIRLTNLMEVV